MPSPTLQEADRVLRICNACRYCEGFCALFPAMELRRTFSGQDLKYLANLCHDCRDCYYACQYAPPHEFDLNLPKILGDLRAETYQEFSWPPVLKRLFDYNGPLTTLWAVMAVFLLILLASLIRDPTVFFNNHLGAGAFYQVIPYTVMVVPFLVLAVFVLYSLGRGLANFRLGTDGNFRRLLDPRANLRALGDVLRMKYLAGAGEGCNYPDERFSGIRRYLHQMVLYGFLLCLASTSVAFYFHHFLNLWAPYPFWSWPVMLGFLGGLGVLAGTSGLIFLKIKMDQVPASQGAYGLDIGFSALLFLTTLSGLALLLFRSTPAMGTLLALHIGFVAGLFLTMPFGKFVHAVYRYAALVRYALEQSGEE
jgi:citrate/tricarballylate utilization protein